MVEGLGSRSLYKKPTKNKGNDTCEWPPPYGKPCFGLANHEFSVTDMLTMGIRGIEFDPWYCFDQMRLAHLGTSLKVGCLERNKLFADGVQEIADFLNKPENTGQIIRVYMNEKADQGHDDLVNHPFQASFGNRALTPSDLNNLYGGKWPTMRKMREDGKNVVIVVRDKTTDRDYTHGDIYIHRYNWTNIHENEFTPYPLCGGKTPGTGPWRSVYNGPNVVGCILDFTELMKCHIHYPASDHTNPQLIRSAVFTWAEGEPNQQLDESSCVFLSYWRQLKAVLLGLTMDLGFREVASSPGFFDVLRLHPSSSFVIHLLPSASSNIFILLPRLHPTSSGVSVTRVFIHLLPPLSCAFVHVPLASSVVVAHLPPSSSVFVVPGLHPSFFPVWITTFGSGIQNAC
ncbi:hypothetical protein BSL78_26204 [Apostichopus japonicus]|uniref:Uncharacterized protein n=1 Tax=Stichopus japonicus TaxID=307972 RepID=A0A2G8JMH1_STIJA|nr:hypothetical protein BSL78_26204 [Apostichopus japonicus]